MSIPGENSFCGSHLSGASETAVPKVGLETSGKLIVRTPRKQFKKTFLFGTLLIITSCPHHIHEKPYEKQSCFLTLFCSYKFIRTVSSHDDKKSNLTC